MIRTKTITTPGRTIDLTIPLAPLVSPCTPAASGLAWFSDTTGDFTEIAEAAYLGAAETLAPVLAVAKVLGETCGEVDWTTHWTPASGSGGDPSIKTDGALLYVYQAAGSVAGELQVSATCAGQTLGPIALTLLAAVGGGSCCPDPQAGVIRRARWRFDEVMLLHIISLSIGGNNLNNTINVNYSYTVDGTEPDSIRFAPPGGIELLTGTLLVMGGDETTSIVVTANLTWDCNGVAQTRTLTWPAFYVIET